METIWDVDEISGYFLKTAEQTERCLWEARRRVELLEKYKDIFDKHLAKFYLYNYLWGRTFLESKDMLIEELMSLLKEPISPASEAYDKRLFMDLWKRNIEDLLKKITND